MFDGVLVVSAVTSQQGFDRLYKDMKWVKEEDG